LRIGKPQSAVARIERGQRRVVERLSSPERLRSWGRWL